MFKMEAKEKFMRKAIEVAQESGRKGDYAIGSVVIRGDKIVSVGEETLKSAKDPVNGHAEIDAIRKACKKLNQPYQNHLNSRFFSLPPSPLVLHSNLQLAHWYLFVSTHAVKILWCYS